MTDIMEVTEVKSAEEIKKFFQRESLYKVMKTTLNMLLSGKKIDFKLNIDGDSYTSTDVLVVGLSKMFHNLNYEEIYIIILALLGHESQHVLSTDLKEYTKYIDEESRSLINDSCISIPVAKEIVSGIGNIVEDGRIENILVNNYPGYISKIQFLNMYIWGEQALEENESKISILMSTIWSLSKLGMYPKNYTKYKDSDVDVLVEEIKPLINKGIKAMTSKDCFIICREIIDKIKPFLIKEYDKDSSDLDSLMDFLNKVISNENYEELEDKEQRNDKQNFSPHIVNTELFEEKTNTDEVEEKTNTDEEEEKTNTDEEEEKTNTDEEEGKTNTDEVEGKTNTDEVEGKTNTDEEDTENSNKVSDIESLEEEISAKNNDEISREKSNKNQKDNKKQENKDSVNKQSDNESNESNMDKQRSIEDKCDKNSSKKKNSNTNKENKSEDNKNIDEQKDSNNYKLSEGIDGSCTEGKQISEDEIARKMKEISEGLKDEISDTFLKANKEDKDYKKELQNKDDFNLIDSEINQIKSKYGFCSFEEYPNDFDLNTNLPIELKVSAKKFRKEIEKIFKNKSMQSVNRQVKGVLNTEDLYRVKMKDYNIFSIEGSKTRSNYAVYVLQDGSGSMFGEKELNSTYALSIIENGLKGIVPLKLTTFTASCGQIQHYTIKNWNDKSRKNYSYNFLQNRRANGCNEDHISIEIATRELLKRPERDKILIILSDGLPSDIRSTAKAIRNARKEKVYVVGIMFGNDGFRKHHYPCYKQMYQKNIIATHPKGIPNRLTKVLKKILIR